MSQRKLAHQSYQITLPKSREESFVNYSVLPRPRFYDILAKKFQMLHTKSSRCTICHVRICMGTNPQ